MAETCPVILFYKYIPIADPAAFASAQRALCSSLGLKGRVLIASEGINGTLAGSTAAVNRYFATLKADARFAAATIQVRSGDTSHFPTLFLRVRRGAVALTAGGGGP